MTTVTPESWSHPEIVRALQRIEHGMESLREEVAGKHREFVPREVWEQAWTSLTEWRQQVSRDVVDLEANAARQRREVEEQFAQERAARAQERADRITGNRWAIGVAVAAAGVISGLVSALGAGGP